MEARNVIIVDDTDQLILKETIERQLKSVYKMNISLINTSDFDIQTIEGEKHYIDVNKLLDKIKDTIKDKQIHLFLTDFGLADENITGLEVVSMIKGIRQNASIMMYSGTLENVVKHVIEKNVVAHDKKIDYEMVINGVKQLVSYNIKNFIKRDDCSTDVVRYFKSDTDAHYDSFFLNNLRIYGTQKFKMGCKFEDKTLDEIANIIDSDSTRSREWMQDFIEQSVSNMIEI